MESYKIVNDTCFSQSDVNMIRDRQCYIGGSDSFSIMPRGEQEKGVLKTPVWGTPYTVWCEKSGKRIAKHSAAMRNGTLREPFIRDECKRLLETHMHIKNVEIFKSPYTYRMKNHDYIGANMDGIIRHGLDGVPESEKTISGLEIKTTSKEAPWKCLRVPDNYTAQIQHYMLVTGLQDFYIVCEFKNKNSEEYTYILRHRLKDTRVHAEMIGNYLAFWDKVVKRRPPQLSGASAENPYIALTKEILPKASDELAFKMDRYLKASKDIIDAKKRQDELKVLILADMGEDKTLVSNTARVTKTEYTAQRANITKLQEDYPDLYGNYIESEERVRLSVAELN